MFKQLLAFLKFKRTPMVHIPCTPKECRALTSMPHHNCIWLKRDGFIYTSGELVIKDVDSSFRAATQHALMIDLIWLRNKRYK